MLSPNLEPALTATGGVLAGMALACVLLSRPLAVARYQATHDELTGLANRRALIAAADRLLRRGRICGLVMLDLDGFKKVNDRYGHAAGDDLLVAVAARLRALPRHAWCARLGGDEFAVLVPGGPRTVAAVAGLARELVGGRGFPLEGAGGVTVEVTASVGYTVASAGATSRALLCGADQAMYVAKSAGRGGGRYAPSAGRAALARRGRRDSPRLR